MFRVGSELLALDLHQAPACAALGGHHGVRELHRRAHIRASAGPAPIFI